LAWDTSYIIHGNGYTVKPVISQANQTLIELIDRIRMLDNDLIRLNEKIDTVIQLRGKVLEAERIEAERK